ncbi:MAG: hypothetical protein PUP91_29845 [Rhizonema sp. PD37]|nr:hypothetical protein [Rhizonema sp. PD37]
MTEVQVTTTQIPVSELITMLSAYPFPELRPVPGTGSHVCLSLWV